METPKVNKIKNMPPAIIRNRYFNFNTPFLIDNYISTTSTFTSTIIKTHVVTPIIKDEDGDLSTPKKKENNIYKTPMMPKNKNMSSPPPPIKKK